MTSFGAPQVVSEEQKFQNTLANTFAGASFTPDTPEFRTESEIAEIERANDAEAGIAEKIYLAASEETVLGRMFQSRSFEPTGYYASKADIEKYASDLPKEVVDQIVDGGYDLGFYNTSPRAESFEEFIYMVKEARETQRNRERLYGGGVGGFTEGLSLAMLASGVEASLVGWAASLLTGFVGAPAAATAGATSVASTARAASRVRTALKGAGLSAAVDIPLETFRTRYDKTLTTNDLLVNWVASVGVGGSLGAAFPNMYLSPLQRAARDAQLEADAIRAAKAGNLDEAAKLRARKTPTKVSARDVVDQKDPTELVMNMSVDQVREEAKKRGIRITAKKVKTQKIRKRKRSNRKIDDIREDLITALRKEADELSERGVAAVDRQIDNAFARMSKRGTSEQVAARQSRYAKVFGVSDEIIKKGGKVLKAAVKRAALQAARRGFVVSGKIGRPKGIKLSFTATVGKDKYQLAGNMERMLWKLANDKGKNAEATKRKISRFLKDNGVENPEKLAADFDARVRQEIKEQAGQIMDDLIGPRAQPSAYVADISRMNLQSGRRVLPDGTKISGTRDPAFAATTKPVSFKVDADLLEVNPKKVNAEPEDSVVLGPNGEKIASGRADDFVGMDADLGADATVPAQGQVMPDDPGRPGVRRAIARGLEKVFDKFTLDFFNPIIYRFFNSNSQVVRKFAAVFMDNPQGGGPASVSSVANTNFLRVIGKLQNTLGIAGREAAKQKRVLKDDYLIRLVRSGVDESKLDAPEAIAVRGLREFFKDLLEYGKANGLPMDNIPDATDYFVRKWNPTKYTSVVAKLGGGDTGRKKLNQFLARAIRAKATPEGQKILTEKKAEQIASRISQYLENPEAKLASNQTISTVSGLTDEIAKGLEDIGGEALEQVGGAQGIAEDLVNLIARDRGDEMNLSFGKRRILLDELHEEVIDGVTVRLDELLDMDIQTLTRGYASRLIGAVAVRKGFGAAFGKETMSLVDAKALIRRQSLDSGDSLRSANLYEKSVEQIYKTMLGIPMYSREMMRLAAISNSLSQATLGMTLGFAQIPEIASIFYRTSFRAALTHFPALKEIRSTFGISLRKNPRQRLDSNNFSSCLECFTTIGGDASRGDQFIRRMDDINFDEEWLKTIGGKYLEAGRLFATMNPLGVMPMDTMLRRWAARASFQNILNVAYTAGKDGKVRLSRGFWKNSRERFAQLGLVESDFERIAKLMKNTELVNVKKGLFGGYKVLDFDFSKADDQEIVDKLVSAIRRNTDSMVQRQTYGEMPWWMHTGIGKVLGQFRTFVSVAKSKQLFAGVARGDVNEIINVVSASYLATLSYQAQTYYRSLGKEDPERYWKERTTDEQLIKNAFSRSGYSTVLPSLLDGAARFLGYPGIIDPSARTTGQALNPLEGSTLYTNIGNLTSFAKRLGPLITQGRDLTQEDYRNLQNLLWFAKIPIFDQLITRHLISMAPERN